MSPHLKPRVTYTLEEAYNFYLNNHTDMQADLPYLLEYGKKVDHITEFGVRFGVSTTAWLYSNPKVLHSYDKSSKRFMLERYQHWAKENGTDFTFTTANVLKIEIEETDLLFIDTIHTYPQLTMELKLHGNKAKKYIVFHDTQENRYIGERGKKPGLLQAITEFKISNPEWHTILDNDSHSGLLIIERTN